MQWLVVRLFLKLTANERRGEGALGNGPDSAAPCYGYCRALEEHWRAEGYVVELSLQNEVCFRVDCESNDPSRENYRNLGIFNFNHSNTAHSTYSAVEYNWALSITIFLPQFSP